MNDYGVITASGTVRFERLLPGPIERVWSYLTESDKRATWLAAGTIELRSGGKVHLRFHHVDLSGEKAPEQYREFQGESHMHGRVVRCEPPRVLSYTWSESSGEDSEVTFELTPDGEAVRLVLTHRRLGDRSAVLSVSSGWHAHLGILEDVLNARKPRLFWTTHAQAEAAYETRLGAGERGERGGAGSESLKSD